MRWKVPAYIHKLRKEGISRRKAKSTFAVPEKPKPAFLRKLENLAEDARETHPHMLLNKLMPPRFVSHCSRHATIDDLFATSPFKLDPSGKFYATSISELDVFISSQTRYSSWKEIEKAAWLEWT